MRSLILLVIMLVLASCGTMGNRGGVPSGSVAWCGDFEYTGTAIKARTQGKALGVSDSELATRMTIEDVIALATALNC